MLSVITPSHDSRWLSECYRSLLNQTNQDWEWIIFLNGDAKAPTIDEDERVKILGGSTLTRIGALKASAASFAEGSIIVEFDHDDWLMPTALESVQRAYEALPDAAMIWTDYAYMEENGEPSSYSYGEHGAWEYTSELAYAKRWHRVCGKPTTRENISRIWFAPNHLRAWPTKQYWAVGGHSDLDILDDQDLMQKLYSHGPFIHIPEMLYLQRRHAQNTQIDPEINARIQELTVQMGDEWLATL